MMQLDTVKVRMPEDAARLDWRALASHPEATPLFKPRSARPVDLVTVAGNEHLGIGLSQIVHDRIAETVTVEWSAKLLGDAYFDGLTLDTLDLAAEALNRSAFLDVTPSALLGADVTRADTFVDLRRGDSLAGDFAAMRTLRTHPRWAFTANGRSPSTSLRWNRTRGHALRAYHKGPELGKPDNRPFLATLKPETWARAADMIRVERQATGNAKARGLCSVAVHERFATLGTLLASTRPAVAETFADLRRPVEQRQLFDEADQYAEAVSVELGIGPGKRLVSEIWRRYGLASFVAAREGDAELCRAWLRSYAGPKASEIYPEVEAACIAYLAGPQAARIGKTTLRLDTLEALLREAV